MLELTPNGKLRTTEPVTVVISRIEGVVDKVTIPANDVSDGYTIPRALWWLFGSPLGQPSTIPALVHDYLCKTAKSYQDRVLADAKFFHLLHEYEVEAWKRIPFYLGVRLCGRYMWWLKRSPTVKQILVVLGGP